MSRSCYSEDYGDDFPGQLELYRANVRRSIQSRAGQARLRELRDALMALPVKELQAEIFAGGSRDKPEVCALGAWALARSGGDVEAASAMVSRDADDHDTYHALKSLGWPKLVVMDAVYMNDLTEFVYDEVEGPHQSPYAYTGLPHRPVRYSRPETSAERYQRVLEWVCSQIHDEAQDATQ